jgi:hypothetical protein
MHRATAQSLETWEPSPITRIASPQERSVSSILMEIIIAICQIEIDLHVADVGGEEAGAVVDEPVVLGEVVEWIASDAAGTGLKWIVVFVVDVPAFGLKDYPGAVGMRDSKIRLSEDFGGEDGEDGDKCGEVHFGIVLWVPHESLTYLLY